MFNIASLLVPLAVDLIRMYIKSSDTKKDDKVLDVVKEGCYYLSQNPSGNNVTVNDYLSLSNKQVFKGGL